VHLERRKLGTCWHRAEGVMRQYELEAPNKSGGEMSVHVLANRKAIKLEHEEKGEH
jgi:hypothetical protein